MMRLVSGCGEILQEPFVLLKHRPVRHRCGSIKCIHAEDDEYARNETQPRAVRHRRHIGKHFSGGFDRHPRNKDCDSNGCHGNKSEAATEHIDPKHFNIDLDGSLVNVRLCCAWVNVRLCCTRLNMRLESAFWNVVMHLDSAMFYMSVNVS